MKIARIELPDHATCHAVVHADGSMTRARGDLYAGLKDSGEPVRGRLLAPLAPANILCIGLNYRKHAEEGGQDIPENPVLFFKATTALQNPGDPIVLPRKLPSDKVDYEAELAVVIGRTCHNVSRRDALDYVLGYTCANDVSARDWQRLGGGGQWCRGKTFATFCPLGPVLVTTDEIPDPNALPIRSILNDRTMQDWNTSDMIFDVPALIEFLSGSTILCPGTVILTGTPHGVGFARKPPVYLQADDVITIEIDGIGALSNPVVEESINPGRLIVAGKTIYGIGWDVGGWQGGNQAVAVARLEGGKKIQWVKPPKKFSFKKGCEVSLDHFSLKEWHGEDPQVLHAIAIDAPLSFPMRFGEFINDPSGKGPNVPNSEIDNPLAFRECERWVHDERGKKPLSAPFDKFGNNATLAMTVVRKLRQEGYKLIPQDMDDQDMDDSERAIIEVYPALVKKGCGTRDKAISELGFARHLLKNIKPGTDEYDAAICAILALCFHGKHASLTLPELIEFRDGQPEKKFPESEGWIYTIRGAKS